VQFLLRYLLFLPGKFLLVFQRWLQVEKSEKKKKDEKKEDSEK